MKTPEAVKTADTNQGPQSAGGLRELGIVARQLASGHLSPADALELDSMLPLSDPQRAVPFFDQIIHLAQQQGDLRTVCSGFSRKAMAEGNLALWAESNASNERALQLARPLVDPLLLARCLRRSVLSLVTNGKAALAIERTSEAFTLMAVHKNAAEFAALLHEMGNLAMGAGLYEQAVACYRRAMLAPCDDSANELGNALVRAFNSSNCLAYWLIHESTHDRPAGAAQVLRQLRRSLDLVHATPRCLSTRIVLERMPGIEAICHVMAGSYERGAPPGWPEPPALSAASEIEWSPRHSNIRRYAAALLAEQHGDIERAFRLLGQSVDETTHFDTALILGIENARGRLHARRDEWQSAYESQERARKALQRQGNEEVQQGLRALLDRVHHEHLLHASFISHDLREPLHAIRTLVQRQQASKETSDGGVMAQLSVLTDRALAYTDGLLLYSELKLLDPSQWTDIYLAELVAEAVDQARQSQAAGQPRIVETLDESLVVRSHVTTLLRVLGNLLTNAAVASPIGTPIDITTTRLGDDAVITIRDRGDGLEDPFLLNIVEATGHWPRTKGHGLGLRYVIPAVRALRGLIVASNSTDGGAMFTLTLPLATDSEPKTPLGTNPH